MLEQEIKKCFAPFDLDRKKQVGVDLLKAALHE